MHMPLTFSVMEDINASLTGFSDFIYTYILIALLLGTGLYFTIRTKGMQVRLFPKMVREIFGSRKKDRGSISSFQAFAVGLASRVGTGNIAGVALAVVGGGPGAVFWMWVVALLGMTSAFVEATLAQLFKIRWKDGTFRGGPAFYIHRGLKSWGWGAAFAVFLIFSFGISYEMVQANTIANMFHDRYGIDTWITGAALVLVVGFILIGGIKRVASISEFVAPLMALGYVLIALVIIVLNFGDFGDVLTMIFQSAFGMEEAIYGTGGGLIAAFLNGSRRGLFSNEAGEGSAPNAASTAQTDHPAKQGLIQAFGVFVDTILVCTATAFILLNATADVFVPGQATDLDGASLTIAAAESQLGSWIVPVLVFMIFIFAFTSLIGNYTYAEVNIDYLTSGSTWGPWLIRSLVIIATFVGAVVALEVAWTLADITMAGMAFLNLIAILALGKWAFGALRDYERTKGAPFVATNNENMPEELPTDIWITRENPFA